MVILNPSLYDEVEMKKCHPCFSHCKRFQILRLGADIKMKCLGCGKVLLVDRDQFNKRLKKIVCSHTGEL